MRLRYFECAKHGHFLWTALSRASIPRPHPTRHPMASDASAMAAVSKSKPALPQNPRDLSVISKSVLRQHRELGTHAPKPLGRRNILAAVSPRLTLDDDMTTRVTRSEEYCVTFMDRRRIGDESVTRFLCSLTFTHVSTTDGHLQSTESFQ
jgi:hypothetical protein